jgi:hypothetical protein
MAYPAQVKDGRIVQIVDKLIVGGGAMVEIFTDQDGQKYTRDLITNHAAHILIPIEDSIALAKNMAAAGADGAEQALNRVKVIAEELGIDLDEEQDESLIEKAEDFIEEKLDEFGDVIEKIEDALGVQDDAPSIDESEADDGAALPTVGGPVATTDGAFAEEFKTSTDELGYTNEASSEVAADDASASEEQGTPPAA